MSLDLGAVFGQAGAVVRQALLTSGTTVSIGRLDEGRGTGTTDPVTLVHTDAVPDVIEASTPAIWAPLGASAGVTVEGLAATEVRIGDVIVLLLPDVEAVQEQDVVKVLTCLDPRLLGREADVITILDSSAAAVRLLHARPRTLGPGGT